MTSANHELHRRVLLVIHEQLRADVSVLLDVALPYQPEHAEILTFRPCHRYRGGGGWTDKP